VKFNVRMYAVPSTTSVFWWVSAKYDGVQRTGTRCAVRYVYAARFSEEPWP
jgi:hypothetical protein